MNVAILMWDEVELLDFAGPASVFASTDAFHIYSVAALRRPLVSQDFLTLLPEYTVGDAPAADVVVIPGGGICYVPCRAPFVDYLKRAGPRAKFILSVGSGSLLLDAAGLPPETLIRVPDAFTGMAASVHITGRLLGDAFARHAAAALAGRSSIL